MKKLLLSFLGLGSLLAVNAQTINTFPYHYDFEGEIQGSTSASAAYTMQTPLWTNLTTDDVDWRGDRGGTGSTNTGPGVDYDPGTATGFYLYIEASSPAYPAKVAILESNPIDLSGVNAMQYYFSYHMYGSTMGSLDVEVTDDAGATWTNVWTISGGQGDVWHTDTINLGAYSNSTIQIRMVGTTGTDYYSDIAIDAVGLYDLLTNDAGIASIDSPTSPACNLGNDVYATIQNYGTDSLFSAQVNWSINGVIQTPFSWADTLTQFESQSIMVGSAPIVDGDTIKVWTSMPNGVAESVTGAGNDSSTVYVVVGMAGNYTIGATGDYATFTDAIADLEAKGACSSVVFEVEDGAYIEQINLGPITGASQMNTITFQSQSGNPNLSILRYGATGTADNWTVKMDGASFYRFKNLTIESTGTSYGRVFDIGGGSHFNRIDSCLVKGDQNVSSTSTNMVLLYAYSGSGNVDSNNVINASQFMYGSYGIYMYGSSSSILEKNNIVENSYFIKQYYQGMRLYYQEDVTIRNNYVELGRNNSGTTYGIYMYYCDGATRAYNNRVVHNNYGYGIYLSASDATPVNPGYLYNNSVSYGDSTATSSTYGIYVSGSNQNVLSNSVNIVGAGTSSRGLYLSGSNHQAFNNNIVNAGNGYGVYYTSSVDASDYNNIYCPNGNFGYLGGAIATQTDWINNTGFDANSVTIDPMYYAYDTLKTCADELNNSAIPNSMISEDILGMTRGTNPDMGAYEFEGVSNFYLGTDTSLCNNQSITIGDANSNSTWNWSNGATTNEITLSGADAGVYIAERTSECGSITDTIEVINIADPTAGFTWNSSYVTGIFTSTSMDADSYLWDFGDGNTSTDENPTHVYNWKGEFIVTLTVTSPCGTDVFTDTVNLDLVSLEENDLVEFNMFPNPTRDNVNIIFESTTNGSVEIIDATGRTLKSLPINNNQMNIDVSSYETGIYFVKVTANGTTKTERLIKQ